MQERTLRTLLTRTHGGALSLFSFQTPTRESRLANHVKRWMIRATRRAAGAVAVIAVIAVITVIVTAFRGRIK
jgi:hypothetical protein